MVIGCAALTRELRVVLGDALDGHDAEDVTLHLLPANLHNRPDRIPGEVRQAIAEHARPDDHVVVAYADCGTGGLLDATLADIGGMGGRGGRGTQPTRLAGAHCYELFAGSDEFAALCAAEPGTFFLTDFLARQFEQLVWVGLGLDRHPELRDQYFGNYRRLVQLGQQVPDTDSDTDPDTESDAELQELGRSAAARLGLEYEFRRTGVDHLREAVIGAIGRRRVAS